MTLLDRFRTPAGGKHPDPMVRLAHVETLAVDDRDAISAAAREDDDPRVRRAAVAKLMAPAALAAVVRSDPDEGVRAQAAAMLRDIALEAFVDVTETDSLEAVEEISDSRVLAQVAKSAAREIVALRAASRVEDARMLGSVARHALVEAARLHAVTTLGARGERGELLAVAMNSDFKDTALAAMESVTDRNDLDLVITRGRNKSSVKRARTLLREADERDAQAAAEASAAATEALIAANPAAIDSEADTVSPPHGDPLAAVLESEPGQAERAATNGATVADAARRGDEEIAHTHAEAQARVHAEAEAAEAAARERGRRHYRLSELVDEAVQAGSDEAIASARKRFGAISREWHEVGQGLEIDPSLAARFAEIEAAFHSRDAVAREADAQARREALTRVQGLLTRLEAAVAHPDLTLKAADRSARDVRAALGAIPPLPSKQDFDEVSRRLKAVQTALAPRLQELRDADDWRRFANVSIQEQLCAKMESLRAAEDPDQVARQVRELQEQWRASADVPRAQAEPLWRRFKAAHDEVWTKCEAHFAEQARERSENLAKKLALSEQAEALAESTAWIETAEAIKKLQAEWKTIGPVSRGREKAVWDRFRAACDRFFTRRHEDLAQRKAAWNENLARKDALCARAEVLAESTDWDAAVTEIKQLQNEWRAIGPVKKTKSEAVWQRFRGACDRFFARYAVRHDTARAERVARREALCAEFEALGTGDELQPDLASAARALRVRWQQEVASGPVDPDTARALDARFQSAFTALLGRAPAAFAGSDLDPEANRKRMETLVRKVEDLAASLRGPAPADDTLSPTTRLATMLKEALASNTIGGKVDEDARFRAAAEELRQVQASWSRIGLVPEDVRRQLTDRFQRAARTITERAGRSQTSPPGRGNPPSRPGRPTDGRSGRSGG